MNTSTSQLLAILEHKRRTQLAQDIDDIKVTAPEIFADAETFVSTSHLLPWDLHAMNVTGELGPELTAIQEKYDTFHARRRPTPDGLTPEQQLFFEACELLYFSWLLEINEDNRVGYNVYN